MELRSLEVFVEVVKQGGFSAASERVCLTQPSISRLIRQLEDEIGTILLDRNHRGVSITDAGEIVYRHALNLLSERERLKMELAALSGLHRGKLALGIPPLGGSLFVPLVREFKNRFPAIDLRLFEKGSRATESALRGGELDLGTLLIPAESADFDSIPFFEDRLVLAVPKSSGWAGKKPVNLAELKNEPLILFPEEFALNERIFAACQQSGFEPIVAGRSGQSLFIEGLVESGVGLAFLPFSVTQGFTKIKTRELAAPGITWQVGLSWLRDSYLSFAAKALIAIAMESLAPAENPDRPQEPGKISENRLPEISPWLSRPPFH